MNLARELFILWPAWSELVEYLTRCQPLDAEPQSVFGAACACDQDRLAARLYGAHIGESLEESAQILEEVLVMASDGTRPKCGRELGLLPEMVR